MVKTADIAAMIGFPFRQACVGRLFRGECATEVNLMRGNAGERGSQPNLRVHVCKRVISPVRSRPDQSRLYAPP